jgi:hypothetical protein
MKMNKLSALLIASLCLLGTACSSDDAVTPESELNQSTAEARSFLTDQIVLNIRAFMGEADKTLLPNGCPVVFDFQWSDTPNTNTLNIAMLNFTMEGMPYVINRFGCDLTISSLNQWEQDEYKGKGWIKFEGKDGWLKMVSSVPNIPTIDKQIEGSSIMGYYNARTHEINFKIDFNQMLVTATAIQQTVDKSRLAKFDEEKKQYEEDFEKYKEEHGLNKNS